MEISKGSSTGKGKNFFDSPTFSHEGIRWEYLAGITDKNGHLSIGSIYHIIKL